MQQLTSEIRTLKEAITNKDKVLDTNSADIADMKDRILSFEGTSPSLPNELLSATLACHDFHS